ncbi:hypothetical protein [Streptomyces sp. GZWMJZ-114]|uniref:hypothetical protein n=1 Tax=Streptomyces sp. GZWMJZ-114 TaxID=2494734 RepID=UPI001013064B|nr:hypothetical protein [Streptomyces sp. GZWMJZ-114]
MPSFILPLLLTARQYRFGGDTDALTSHLIDTPRIAWETLGTDLLDTAPGTLVDALTDGEHWASTDLNLVTPDGSPAQRMAPSESTASDDWISWSYVLRADAIEVIPVAVGATSGRPVPWTTPPHHRFADDPTAWRAKPSPPAARLPQAPAPAARPQRANRV